MQLVIRNGRLAVPGAAPEGLVDLLIDEGRFAAVEPAGVRVDDVAQEIDVQRGHAQPSLRRATRAHGHLPDRG